jgi:hypothetical protein
LDRLKLLAERKIVRGLTTENAALLLHATDAAPSAMAMKETVLRFCLDHFDRVTKTEAFHQLSRELILELLQRR